MDEAPSRDDILLVAHMAGYARTIYEEAAPGHVDALDRVLRWLGEEVPPRTIGTYTYVCPSNEDVRRVLREGEQEMAEKLAEIRRKLPAWGPELDTLRITI